MTSNLESRALIAEFFHTGEKNYTPKDFIEAVRDGTADTALAPVATETELADTAAGAWLGESGRVTETAIPAQSALLAWSGENDEADELLLSDGEEPDLDGDELKRNVIAWGCFIVALVVAMSAAVWWFTVQTRTSTTTAASTTTSSAAAAVPECPSYPCNPAVTVTEPPPIVAAPPAQIENRDANFIASLRNARFSWTFPDSGAIGLAHQICTMLGSGVAPAEILREFRTVNPKADSRVFLEIATQSYCPEYHNTVAAPSGDN